MRSGMLLLLISVLLAETSANFTCYHFASWPAPLLDFPMNASFCNQLMAGVFPYFVVTNASCMGVNFSTLPTSPLPNCSRGDCGTYLYDLALHSTVLNSTANGEYRTGYFGSGNLTTPDVPSWGRKANSLYINFSDHIALALYGNETINSVPVTVPDVNFSIVPLGEMLAITEFSLSFSHDMIVGLSYTSFTLKRRRSWGDMNQTVVSVLPTDVKGPLVLASLEVAGANETLRMAFEWVEALQLINKAAQQRQWDGCLSNSTRQKFFLANLENVTCQGQLAYILTANQEGFSWVLIGLLAAALFFDCCLLLTSRFCWRDRGVDYLTVITASFGVVEYASEVLMIRSLSQDEEFLVEFWVCLGALLASSALNLLGNLAILKLHGHFSNWLESRRLHRVCFVVCSLFSFFKGNLVAVLSTRLNHVNTQLFQMPLSRRIQLRFRVLGLFVLCFSSLPQLVVIVLLHDRLDEWTPLNALFVAVSISGCAVVVWRAFFELTFKEHGKDKDRNMEEVAPIPM